MKAKNIANVEPILGTITDPKLPPEGVDLIVMVDVYHEFDHPYEMTDAMVKALKPGGRLVFVEYRLEDKDVPIKLVHKMSQKQVVKEMAPHPLRFVKTLDDLPWQHIIIFEKKADKDNSPGEMRAAVGRLRGRRSTIPMGRRLRRRRPPRPLTGPPSLTPSAALQHPPTIVLVLGGIERDNMACFP